MSRVLYNDWVDNFADVIYRFALKNTRDSEQAKDLVQDAFEKLWIKKDQIDASKAKAYLFQIVSNALIDRARRAKLNATFREQLSSNDSLVFNESVDLKKTLEDAVAKLPDIQRHVILLRDYEGYSYEEIGEITSLSEQQVKVYIFRARQKLRSMLVNPELIL
ncbi:MAG: RNA polymerase sigma factor [Flavobacteriales bacterium]|jgi:RNA polymerase sigma factor (sigma-70 family)